ncbi:MAG: hypothetical protein HY928_06825 [Elusimicrobia bacterium]|nr:hypothetical protein [Elusimicrobiota bacterium]
MSAGASCLESGAVGEPDDAVPIVILDDDEVPAIPAQRLAAIYSYGTSALSTFAGAETDRRRLASLRQRFDLGWLPATVGAALPSDLAPWEGRLAERLCLPVTDAQGALVDLWLWPLAALADPAIPGDLVNGTGACSVLPRAGGVDLVVAESLADAVAAVEAGQTPWLCRDAEAATATVSRLRSLGAQRIRCRDAAQVARYEAALAGSGIAVALPDQVDAAPRIVARDERHHRVTATAGPLTVVAEEPQPGRPRGAVILRRGDRAHEDAFDLRVPAQRGRFVEAAGRRLDHPVEPLRALVDWLAGELAGAAAPVVPAEPDRLVLHPLPALLAAWDALGWVGDERAKTLAVLAVAGSRLDDPPWITLRGDQALTAPALSAIAAALPADRVVRMDRPGAILTGGRNLRGAVLLCGDTAAVRGDHLMALRLLKERGAVSTALLDRNPQTGAMLSSPAEVRGPAAFIGAEERPGPIAALTLPVPLDASPAQLGRLLAATQRRAAGGAGGTGAATAAAGLWAAFLADLPAQVVVPFATRVAAATRSPRDLADLRLILALVQAHAAVHHRQRERQDGAVAATEADFHAVVALVRDLVGQRGAACDGFAGELLAAWRAAGGTPLTTAGVVALVPGTPRTTVVSALNALLERRLVDSPSTGRGRGRARTYALVDPFAALALHLRPSAEAEKMRHDETGFITISKVG